MSSIDIRDFIKVNTENIFRLFIIEKCRYKLPNNIQLINLHKIRPSQISKFLNNNTDNSDSMIKIIYDKKYITWLLRNLYNSLSIGITFNKKLIAICGIELIDSKIYNHYIKLPIVRLFCVYRSLRKIGFAKIMMSIIMNRIIDSGYEKIYFSSNFLINTKTEPPSRLAFASSFKLIIPLNQERLIEAKLLPERINYDIPLESNILKHMMVEDIDTIVDKLNYKLKKYNIARVYNKNYMEKLLSRKQCCMTYVKRDNDTVTDFISVRIEKFRIDNKDFNTLIKYISNAHVLFYYNETLTASELFLLLMGKLVNYEVDQITYTNTGENPAIDITHFESNIVEYSYIAGASVGSMKSHQINIDF